MRAVVARDYGPPESFSLEEIDLAPPAPGEARVRIHAAGVSFVDVLLAKGLYQVKPPLPYIPGTEFAGVVEAVGEGVTTAKVGDRVCGSSMGGVFAQALNVAADRLFTPPPGVDFREAAVFKVSYGTAYHALVQRGRLAPGETLLVLGAGGATGYAAVQVGKALGARVIASASSRDKQQLALDGGADAAVTAGAPDWREQVKAAAPGGIDVVFDPIGGEATEPAFRSLRWNGRHLVIGFVAGIPKLGTNLALVKGAHLIGVDIRQFAIYEPDLAQANEAALQALQTTAGFKPPVGAAYPLERWVEAMSAVTDNTVTGRVVLDIA